MRLTIVRHAEALPKEEDPARGLSPRGREQARSTAAKLAELGAAPAQILHSDKARARQTAEQIAEALGARARLRQVDWLSPEAPVQPAVERIAAAPDELMLVGHLPFVDRLLGELLQPVARIPDTPPRRATRRRGTEVDARRGEPRLRSTSAQLLDSHDDLASRISVGGTSRWTGSFPAAGAAVLRSEDGAWALSQFVTPD
ncbi:MAG: histidine phosphatase family protein [Deltaproteobacteria bacterium]|nr:histidine phosphatase family protein [Deltaproteobacteria bacterium]